MTRPRESILSQFDPLHGAEDLSDCDSDKENSAPPEADMTLGTFFMSFKPAASSQPMPIQKRLVDIGDSTYLGGDSEDEDDDEDSFFKLDLENTPKAEVQCTPRPVPRTPFAELQLDREITPVAAKRALKRQLFPNKGLVIGPGQTESDSTLSSLIDSITTQGVSFSQSKIPTSPVPEIKVSSPDPTPTAAQFAIPSATVSPSSLRPTNMIHKSSNDRLSLDLHSSFQMHFESEDASFDLLNDKISFLGHASRDFDLPSGDEEETDGETTPPAKPQQNGSTKCRPTFRPSSSLSIDLPEDNGASRSERLVEQKSPLLLDELHTDEEEVLELPAKLSTPVTKLGNAQAPPPVPALRIVKRTKTVFSAERRMSSRPPQRVDELPKAPEPRSTRTSMASTSAASRTSHKMALTSSQPISIASDASGMNGPRRVPIAPVESTTKTATVPTKVPPGGGPRRIKIADLHSQRNNIDSVRDAVNAIGNGKGASIAKAPRRMPFSSAPVAKEGSRTTSIPRPVSSMSRLPAPTFGNRTTRSTKATTAIARRV